PAPAGLWKSPGNYSSPRPASAGVGPARTATPPAELCRPRRPVPREWRPPAEGAPKRASCGDGAYAVSAGAGKAGRTLLHVSVGPYGMSEKTAIYPERLAGDEIARFRREKNHRARNTERLADAAQRSQSGPRGGVIARFLLRALDLDRAGRHAVHAYAILAQFHGRNLREHFDAALARRIIDEVWKRNLV